MIALIARGTTVASSSSIASTTATPVAAVVAWGLSSVGVGSAVAWRRIALWRWWPAIGRIVGVGHATASWWWRWSSGVVPTAGTGGSPAGRHGWHATMRRHKTGVQMGREGVGSMAATIVHTATTAVSQGSTAKRASRVVCFGLDSLNVCVIESWRWELDASKEHRFVDVRGFGHFVVDTMEVS